MVVKVHRHVHLVGKNRAKAAQVYPKELCEAILRGLKRQLEVDGSINAVEELISGPSPDDYVEWQKTEQDYQEKVFDATSGAELDPELVKKARQEEMDWLHKENVYTRVPSTMCTGKLLKLKWVDVNKGDAKTPKVRSRIVAKEVKKAESPEEQLRPEETFSSTPPLEAVYSLMSVFMTSREAGKKKMMASWDISRAHFMGKAARELYVELPDEDKNLPGDVEPMIGRLERSMYGTQDASHIFQQDYTDYARKEGAEFSALCPAVFKFKDKDLIGLVHGDDFLVVGEYENLCWLDKLLNKRYTARWGVFAGKAGRQESGDVLPEPLGALRPRWSGRRSREA